MIVMGTAVVIGTRRRYLELRVASACIARSWSRECALLVRALRLLAQKSALQGRELCCLKVAFGCGGRW